MKNIDSYFSSFTYSKVMNEKKSHIFSPVLTLENHLQFLLRTRLKLENLMGPILGCGSILISKQNKKDMEEVQFNSCIDKQLL